MRSARHVSIAPSPDATTTAKFGTALWDTQQRRPELHAAIAALDATFQRGDNGPSSSNKSGRLVDGREVVVLSGCRFDYACEENGYAMVFDATQGKVAFVEQTGAPHAYLLFGGTDPTLRDAVLEVAAVVFHETAKDLSAPPPNVVGPLRGVTMLPRAALSQRYGMPGDLLATHADVASAVKRVSGGYASLTTSCGARLPDGRELLLMNGLGTTFEAFPAYGIAYDAHRQVAFVARVPRPEQLSAPTFSGEPDPVVRAVVLAVADGCVAFAGKIGLAPNGTHPGVDPPPNVDAAIANYPTEADCARLPRAPTSTAANQMELTEQSADRLTVAECALRRTYHSLALTLASTPAGLGPLERTQKTWRAYLAAHEAERFSHESEQGYYGSMLGMCVSGENESLVTERTRELKAMTPCTESAGALARETEAARVADAAMSTAYFKMMAAQPNEPLFKAAFEKAQMVWLDFRAAQTELAGGPQAGTQSACGQRESARLARVRTEIIRRWEAGSDGCMWP